MSWFAPTHRTSWSPRAFSSRRQAALYAALLVGTVAGIASVGASREPAVPPAVHAEGKQFIEDFNLPRRIPETATPEESADPNWWVNSGGFLAVESGFGMTAQGDLPIFLPWRSIYAESSPRDTDGGKHPQNLFRLVTRHEWQDSMQEIRFRIGAYRTSDSAGRAASNGVLFFSRYQDGDNLYYLGVRVDGYAVIKKKKNGVYYTLDYEPFLATAGTYDRTMNPNLIPPGSWFDLRAFTQDTQTGVHLTLYANYGFGWRKVAEAVDTGSVGGPTFSKGRAGIRTDFMDVTFDRYAIHEMN